MVPRSVVFDSLSSLPLLHQFVFLNEYLNKKKKQQMSAKFWSSVTSTCHRVKHVKFTTGKIETFYFYKYLFSLSFQQKQA